MIFKIVMATNRLWRIYWTWIKRSYDVAMNELSELEALYRQKRVMLDKLNGQVHLNILKEHLIIGLTTTCAAKLHDTIRDLGAPIGKYILNFEILLAFIFYCSNLFILYFQF